MTSTAAIAPTSHHRTGASVCGASLVFENLSAASADVREPADEETLLRVISGLVALTMDGDERVLAPGDETIVPAARAHRLTCLSAEARVMTGLRRTPR